MVMVKCLFDFRVMVLSWDPSIVILLMHKIPVPSSPIIQTHDSLHYLFILLSGLRHCESEMFAQENNTIDSKLALIQTS